MSLTDAPMTAQVNSWMEALLALLVSSTGQLCYPQEIRRCFSLRIKDTNTIK